jgi:hypothetical protein
MEFLNVQATIGKSGLSYSDLDFNSFDLAKDWGQTTIDPIGLDDFRKRLEADDNYTLKYLVSKLGFNPQDGPQLKQGLQILTEYDLVTRFKHRTGEYLCLMHYSLNPQEFLDCAATANTRLFLQ